MWDHFRCSKMVYCLFVFLLLAFSDVRAFQYASIDSAAQSYSGWAHGEYPPSHFVHLVESEAALTSETIGRYRKTQRCLPELPYPTGGLAPWIDAATVHVHYNGHHRAYTTNMNAALQKWREEIPGDKLHEESITVILEHLQQVPEQYRMAVRNHGGGFVNHLFYWSVMSPNSDGVARTPRGALRADIEQQFGSFDQFRAAFTHQAKTLFGSGYVWLVRNTSGGGGGSSLDIINTGNQDCPLTRGRYPLLVIDVWEHAYYLEHKNKRPNYIDNWWMVVDWDKVNELDEFWKKRNAAKDEL